MSAMRRKFDEDIKIGAVHIVRETGKPIAQVEIASPGGRAAQAATRPGSLSARRGAWSRLAAQHRRAARSTRLRHAQPYPVTSTKAARQSAPRQPAGSRAMMSRFGW